MDHRTRPRPMRRWAGTNVEYENLKRTAVKLSKQMQDLRSKVEGSSPSMRHDKFSMRLQQLEVGHIVVLACCELLPYTSSGDDNSVVDSCRCHLQGAVLEQIKVEKRAVKQQMKEAVILELEEWDMRRMFAPFLEGTDGAMKELVEGCEKHKGQSAMSEKLRREIQQTCELLCMFAMECLSDGGQPQQQQTKQYDLHWIAEMLSLLSAAAAAAAAVADNDNSCDEN